MFVTMLIICFLEVALGPGSWVLHTYIPTSADVQVKGHVAIHAQGGIDRESKD